VIMPGGHVCCGRPLYDYGFLDQAERYLRKVLDVLREPVRAGIPVVGMEPSCLAVFKDELTKILPHDDDAARLAGNAYHFGEFFRAFDVTPPRFADDQAAQAVLWGHCHHRATGGVGSEQRVLEQMGVSTESVVGGCCGLAGSWGFEDGKWQISLDCGEQAFLPAARSAPAEAVVVANGFSCQTQLQQAPGTGSRQALHLAQVMALARQGKGTGARRRDAGARPAPRLSTRLARTAPVALAALAAGAVPVSRLARGRR
jgi:Fe-S oxidoreductase